MKIEFRINNKDKAHSSMLFLCIKEMQRVSSLLLFERLKKCLLELSVEYTISIPIIKGQPSNHMGVCVLPEVKIPSF
jgi:hypothetical protein